jgi:hypothetical protein
MPERPLVQRSWLIVVLTATLLITTGAALFHWHKDWTDQGCQLCHVRHLPTLYSAFAAVHIDPPASSQEWNLDTSSEELESWVGSLSTRAPPAFSSFNL